jgi:hypothetical protein
MACSRHDATVCARPRGGRDDRRARGGPLTFKARGDQPARILVLFTPSGMEAFFDRFAALETFEPKAFAEIGASVGMDVTGPPLR